MSSSRLEHSRREEELSDESDTGEAEDSRSEQEDQDGEESHVVGYSQCNEHDAPVPKSKLTVRSAITLGVLVFINLLNYMDRFTVAGVLTQIQKYFDIEYKTAGLLQTVFTCSYMVFAPLFGYLGDRYSRKYVMAAGILIWSVTTFLGSLVNSEQLVWFFVIRGLVGIGEASYSTVAPTIIADMFLGDSRTKALSLFYFAIPCGSGLGYIVGSKVAEAAGDDWHWAFRVTPGLGVLCVILCMFVVHEPKRGAVESESPDLKDVSASLHHESSSYLDDIKSIFKVKSFVHATVGFTCVSFVVGSLAFWAPSFVLYSEQARGKDVKIDDVSYIFGIITFLTGVIGVWTGSEISRRYRKKNKKSDAIVCGLGIFASIPFLYFSLYLADKMIYLTWVLIALGEILLCLNWAPNADLLLYVIVPSRRSTAEAVQILLIHLFGDATSPFIVGNIADAVQGNDQSAFAKQKALLYALLITPFVSLLGAIAYYFCAKHLVHDREVAEKTTKKASEEENQKYLESMPPSNGDQEDPAATVCVRQGQEGIDYGQSDEIASDKEQLIPAVSFRD
ncbi:protein spinster homolog 1-like [Rhopilema esculentum]|uniref:protein spinster homolog 1-like n=1 Tax=Rhopilema esculentum TaxID=499914 RepID=UPI0031E3F5CB|eukprot:gene15302-6516_t